MQLRNASVSVLGRAQSKMNSKEDQDSQTKTKPYAKACQSTLSKIDEFQMGEQETDRCVTKLAASKFTASKLGHISAMRGISEMSNFNSIT